MSILLQVASAADAAYGLCVDYPCPTCQPAPIEQVLPDSVLPGSYGAHLAFDGDLTTAWCEGVSGTGIGQGLHIALTEPKIIESIAIHGGYFKSRSLLAANGRVKAMSLVAENGMGGPRMELNFTLADPAVIPEQDTCAEPGTPMTATPDECFLRAGHYSGAMLWQNDGTNAQPVAGISLTIADVYPGAKYADTCISEIEILVRE